VKTRMYLIFAIIIISAAYAPSFGGARDSTLRINDGAKTSAKYDDIFAADTLTVKRMRYLDVKYMLNILLEGINLGEMNDSGDNSSYNLYYKNTKAGFNHVLTEYQKKLNAAGEGVVKKLREWNTVLPVLENMKDSMAKMVNSKTKVMQDTLWLQRDSVKWKRNAAAENGFTVRTFNVFSEFVNGKLNSSSSSQNRKTKIVLAHYDSLFMYNSFVDADDDEAIEAVKELPDDILGGCAEAIALSYEMIAKSHLQDDSVAVKVETVLNDKRRTMMDERQLQAFIERYRYNIGVTTTELEQTLLMLEQKYARLLLRDAERRAIQNQNYYEAVDKFVMRERER